MGEDIKTWSVNRWSDTIRLNTSLPDSSPENLDTDNVIQELQRRATHAMPGLNSAFEGHNTATGSVSVFPRSAPIDKLRMITKSYSSEGRYTFVDRQDIRQQVESGAINYESSRIDEITENIIENAKNIGY